MADGWFAAIELLLVFGGVMAWIVWELRSLKRAKARDLDSNNKADRQP
jgi:hypothetical protein